MIGAGAIAINHCGSILEHPQGEVTAIADLSLKRAKAVQKQFNIKKVTTKWQDVVSDPDIDAVAIALPNFLHAPVSIAALKAGKHVLLDKPFALDYKEAKEVAAVAKKAKKVLMLGMNQRYRPESQSVRAMVDRGELGDIYHAKGTWLRRTGSPKFGTWFCDKKLAGGGCLLDIGVHMLDLSLFLMNNWKPVSVFGNTYTNFGNRGIGEGGWGKSDRKKGKATFNVDDFATAVVRFKNGATLDLNISWVAHQAAESDLGCRVYGTEGGANAYPLELYRFGKKKGEYEVVTPQNIQLPKPECNRHVDWINAILKKSKPLCTIDQALTVQKIIDGIYKSSKTGQVVKI
jgi:predicted dehydrogenase